MDGAFTEVSFISIPNRFHELMRGSLPFYIENSCALGIAVKTYLDELCTREDPTSESTRAEMKGKGQGWIEYSDFSGSLEDAFRLWDAVGST